MVFFTIPTAEASNYTSVVEQRNPISLQDTRNKQMYVISGLQGRVSLKVAKERVLRALRIESYPGLSDERIIARLKDAKPEAVSWKAGQVGPYAFHKVDPNKAVVLYRASHNKEWVLIDSITKKAVMSLYCGNPLQDNRVVRQMMVKTIRITAPESHRVYTPRPRPKQRQVVERIGRQVVPVKVTQPQTRAVYAQKPVSSGSSNINGVISLLLGSLGNNAINGGWGGSTFSNYANLPVYSGCNTAINPTCGGSFIPQANGGVAGTNPVTGNPVIGAPVAGFPGGVAGLP